MLMSDLIGAEELAHFRETRWQAYAGRAADFLRRRFPRAVRALSANELDAAIRDAAIEARQAGFRAERDLLLFLAARVMLGRRFVLNPLYLDMLHAAGWVDQDGRPMRHLAFAPLFEQIEAWDRIRAADLSSARRLAVRFARLYQDAPPDLLAALHATLPACSAAVRPQLLAVFGQAAGMNARAAELDGPDVLSFAGVAVLLGLEFHADPFFPGITQALARNPPRTLRRSLAFGAALKEILLARLDEREADAV